MASLTYDRPVTYQSHMFNPHSEHESISIKLEPHCSDYFIKDSFFDVMTHGSCMEEFKFKHKLAALTDPVSPPLTSWTTKHPQHWTKKEVLDWIFFVVEQEHLDGSKLQGEAYSSFVGEDLCKMNKSQFIKADPYYGSKMYETFRNLINDVSFEEPKPALDVACLDSFNSVNNIEYTGLNRNINRGVTGRSHGCGNANSGVCDDNSDIDLMVYHSDNDIKVNLLGLGVYSISRDFELPTTNPSTAVLPSKLREGESFTQPLLPLSPSHLPQFSSLSSPMTSSSMSSYTKQRSLSSSSEYPPSSNHSFASTVKLSPSHAPCSTSSSSAASSSRPLSKTASLSLSLSLSLPQTMLPSSSSLSPCRMDKTEHDYSSDDSSASYMPPYHQGSSINARSISDDMNMEVGHHSVMFSSSSFPDDCQMPKKKDKKSRNNATKNGNHLWEFVRDLLRDPKTNPKLLKWEDKDHGVFRFVQSEKVAQLWGEKKNNPLMTYEKLSRAMRFCRTAGYFDSVPKTGKFPKKLCFMFGEKAHGWRD